ncbi:hypothetical protein UlMin_021883 [Ulmus minor]
MGNTIRSLCNKQTTHYQTIKTDPIAQNPNPNPNDDAHDQSEIDDGQPRFICEICYDSKPLRQSLDIKGCGHFYCFRCIIKYVECKLEDNIARVLCPVSGCEGVLEPDHCRSILPRKVFDLWDNALCESVIDGSQKLYCPFRDCSALLIHEGGKRVPDRCLCPHCRRFICARCEVPWHSEFGCGEFQRLMKLGGDKMLTAVARKNKWTRCPNCKFYVERSVGCSRMTCRCGCSFCYKCGGQFLTNLDFFDHSCEPVARKKRAFFACFR